MKDGEKGSYLSKPMPEALVFGSIYIFVALINLRLKLRLTPAWFKGNLAENHESLLAFQYANNEQSRFTILYS